MTCNILTPSRRRSISDAVRKAQARDLERRRAEAECRRLTAMLAARNVVVLADVRGAR